MRPFASFTDVLSAAQSVIPHLLSGQITSREGFQAADDLVSYAADQALPPAGTLQLSAPLDAQQAVDQLNLFSSQNSGPYTSPSATQNLAVIPWLEIAKLLIPLISGWLSRTH